MTRPDRPSASWRKDRRKTAERGYGHRWRVARADFLRQPENALCRYCARSGRVTEAKVVDHIVPHEGDEALFWDRTNWQPLCKTCHDTIKAQEEGRVRRKQGVDDEGWPI
jgi:5-methylcytosine-specific restriction protein A